MKTATMDGWVERALKQPVAFAQVREDPTLDFSLLKMLGKELDVVMIASGGCTAAALVASGRLAKLHLVDAHPAQIALTKLKLLLLRQADVQQRWRLLGHAPQPEQERRDDVLKLFDQLDLVPEILGDRAVWSLQGLDQCGRYEMLFAALRNKLGKAPQDSEARAEAFRKVMSQENLETLFGPAATANRVPDFWRHFHHQTERALSDDPAADGPFLSQLLRGRFGSVGHCWLELSPPAIWPHLTFTPSPMLDVLSALDSTSCDFVHLSNILDWLSPEQAEETLSQAARVLRPGGIVAIRQLNSTLKIRELHAPIEWQKELSRKLLDVDKSFFYRDFHVGRRVS